MAVPHRLARDDCPDALDTMAAHLAAGKVYNVKKVFTEVANAMLDIRLRLPPIYHIDPKAILLDTKETAVTFLITEDMF